MPRQAAFNSLISSGDSDARRVLGWVRVHIWIAIAIVACGPSPAARTKSAEISIAPAPKNLASAAPPRSRDASEIACLAGSPMNDGCATIVLDWQMSSTFVPKSVRVELDGVLVYERIDPASLTNLQSVDVARSASLPAGPHVLRTHIVMGLAPPGPWVQRAYKFDVKSTQTITVMSRGIVEEHIVPYEKGGVTTPLEERPAVRYKVAYF